MKVAEIGIMGLGAWGLWQQSIPVLLAALFGLGTHSTVFGPIKYALLPQHLREDELVAGNALIEAGTFLAILLGTILGGSVVLFDRGALVVGGCRSVVCVRGMAHRTTDSFRAGHPRRRCAPAAPSARHARRRRPRHDAPTLLLPMLAMSWFWLFGATVVSGLPSFAKDVLFANEQVVTMMLALFAVGVGWWIDCWPNGCCTARSARDTCPSAAVHGALRHRSALRPAPVVRVTRRTCERGEVSREPG